MVHLSARTDLQGRTLAEYDSNVDGTMNVARMLAENTAVNRAIFASSMLVCRNGYTPASDDDYCPSTAYGKSKVEGERQLRRFNPDYGWCIVRPTSIWGPWFEAPYRAFFLAVCAGHYVHPQSAPVYKHMGFVHNTVQQLLGLLQDHRVNQEVFYLGDYERYSTHQLANCIQDQSNAPHLRELPLSLMRLAAQVGDLLAYGGMSSVPLTSFRLQNMLTGSGFSTERLEAVTGPLRFSMKTGVQSTLRWLSEHKLLRRRIPESVFEVQTLRP